MVYLVTLYNSSIQNLSSKCAPDTQTKALRRRRYWLIAASTTDSLVLRSLIDVSYFGAVNFIAQNTPDAVFC